MEPLRTSDPAKLADYRLLGRLGAGGMGVVYLARSAGGTLVALKVIQAELAEDDGFRERFRREAETARRMTSPWVASLVDADPDAAEPWLATTFVPGPSLGEAVAEHGPLPVRSLRVLGARLADALRELHSAHLVHRDVKPGNVLLALDGPRLIDFGVARDAQDTSLTSTGVVVGTPGFLSPEQARGGGESGPEADVFSLGCLLAYAATGRPPFGTGSADALLYRAAHDAPDLDGVPAELTEVIVGCLEKAPRDRPTAEALAETLTAAGTTAEPSGDAVPDVPDDPREALRKEPLQEAVEDSIPAPVPQDEAWLPEPLVRLIAERSAAGLALPGIDDTEIDASADPAVETPPPSRRRFLLLAGGAAAVAVAGGGAAAWAALSRDDGNKKPPAATGPVHTIALHADLSGDQKAVGRAQEQGLRLAVAEFNARRNKPFKLAVRTVDDAGDPARAPVVAKELVADSSVLAVIGPTTDGCALAALATYDAASLPMIAVSPGATVLGVMGSRSFLHARVTDTIQPFYMNAYLRGTGKSRSVGIVDDRAADAYAYASELSSTLAKIQRDAGQPFVPKVVSALRTDFGPTLDALLAGGADSVAFAGYHDRAALMARVLDSRGFPGARVGAHGLLDARFLSEAGAAADGWAIVAPVMDATVAPEAKTFAAAYRAHFDADPEPYAAEAYDVAQMTVQSLSELASGQVTRSKLTTALRSATYKGITKNFAFNKDTGILTIDGTGVYLWKVDGGRFAYQGVASFQAST
ncbi:bifunctional serine/threonine-protein kinase/ABC transporter substrate-binding protein [Streptomyces sp. NBC_00028]|uniref:bifunctional serine/threonine-protein kinase/ABC transporter substrate-binding protein n=1 Tax=Streptomyces sp. NBC_00028 TaxID=2975624 RepID=UPI0032568A79